MTSMQIFLIGVYFALLLICSGLMVFSDMLSIAARETLLPVSADGFKLVIGALVGSVSSILGASSRNGRKKDAE